MKLYKTIKVIILFFLVFTFSNCDSVVDCLYGIRPNLVTKELNSCQIYYQYNDNLTFEMHNTSVDDYFISDLIVEGNIPPGINYDLLNDHTINFSGVPDKKGVYEFTVEIVVSPYVRNSDGSDNMCGDTASKKYKITIN